MECVAACSDTQIAITDEQFWDKPICRSFEYYVNSESTEIIELGTRKYPYKNIGLPFVEILNYHAHSDRSITVYVKESTENRLIMDSNIVVNITEVTVTTFADSGESGRADIAIVKDEIEAMMSSKTVFNIMKHNTLRLNEVLNPSLMEEDEIYGYTTAFLVNRASFTLDKLNVVAEFDDSTMVDMIRSVYNSAMKQSLTNMFIKIQGGILVNYSVGTSIYIDNVEFDMYQTVNGVVNDVSCNFPEAVLNHTFEMYNTFAYYSDERTLPLSNLFSITGDPNVTIVNATWDNFYGLRSNNVAPLEIFSESNCQPQDEATRVFTFKHNYATLKDNPNKDRLSCVFLLYSTLNNRKEVIYYYNNMHEDMDSYYGFVAFILSPSTTTYFENNTFTGMKPEFEVVYNSFAGASYWKNTTINDCSEFLFNLMLFEFLEGLVIDGISFSNISTQGDSFTYFVKAVLNEGTDFSITNMELRDTVVQYQPFIYGEGRINRFLLTNSVFENLQVLSDNSMFKIDSMKSIQASNLTFSNVVGVNEEDADHYLFSIISIDMSGDEDSFIKDISIDSSKIAFLLFDGVHKVPSSQRIFTIENLKYSNIESSVPKNLINFRNAQTKEDFKIKMNNISFENIYFSLRGNLINARSQMTNSILITNLAVSNVTEGSIRIEVNNKQNELPSILEIHNITTNAINAKYGSFFLLNEGGQLIIRDSVVKDIHCYEEGAVLFAGYQKTVTNIYNSVFTNNTSVKGGVFNIESESVVKLHNSTITNNFAIETGVLRTSIDGYFEFNDVNIYENYAISMPIGEIFDTASLSTLNN